MPAPSNADLALKMSDLIDRWNTYTVQLQNWLAGTATGGPFSNGTYPLTNSLGTTFYVPCPAAEAARVDAEVNSAQAFRDEAAASATSSASSATAATTARDIALSYRDAAQAAKDLALLYRDEAANSASQALTYRNTAQSSAIAAAADAAGAADSEAAAEAAKVAAVAAQVAAEAAAAAAATFDPADFRRLDTLVPWADLSSVPAFASRWPTWSEVTSKPTTFAPSAHTHVIADVTGLQTALDAKLATANFTWTNLSGKPTTFAPSAHTHAIADVTGLQTALDAKLATTSFTWANLSGKPSTFAPSAHTHAIADVTGLQAALDGASGTGTANTWTALQTFSAQAQFNQTMRVTGMADFASGSGLEFYFSPSSDGGNGIGLIVAVDRTSIAWKNVEAYAKIWTFFTSGSQRFQLHSTGGTLTGQLTSTSYRATGTNWAIEAIPSGTAGGIWVDSATRLRFINASFNAGVDLTDGVTTIYGEAKDSAGHLRDVPQNVQNANYTFALTDRGRHVIKTNNQAYTWTIPLNSSVAFPVGTLIEVINDNATGAVTLARASGVALVNVTSDADFALNAGAARRLLKVGTDRWRLLL